MIYNTDPFSNLWINASNPDDDKVGLFVYPTPEVFWKNLKQEIPNLVMYILLDLSNNQLSGEIPDSLGSLKSLKLLNLSHNKLSEKYPWPLETWRA